MRDARDAEDKRLLDDGRIDELLAGYYEIIVGRCVAKMRGSVGHDVAHAVCSRLWRELKEGKHRDGRWPFRVIVHQVIKFTCSGWYEQGWGEVEWEPRDEPVDPFDDVDTRLTLEEFVETLPPVDREVAVLQWLTDPPLEPAEIAVRTGALPNAVYQSSSRNRERLRAWLEA